MKAAMKVMLTLILSLCLVGCGASDAQEQKDFGFFYQDTYIQMNAEAAAVIGELGTPQGYTEEPSCAFEGMDKTYDYGSFCLTTYPADGVDYFYSLWFTDETVQTEEGIHIGSTREEVEQLLGADWPEGETVWRLTAAHSELLISLEGDQVSSIQYRAMVL